MTNETILIQLTNADYLKDLHLRTQPLYSGVARDWVIENGVKKFITFHATVRHTSKKLADFKTQERYIQETPLSYYISKKYGIKHGTLVGCELERSLKTFINAELIKYEVK